MKADAPRMICIIHTVIIIPQSNYFHSIHCLMNETERNLISEINEWMNLLKKLNDGVKWFKQMNWNGL